MSKHDSNSERFDEGDSVVVFSPTETRSEGPKESPTQKNTVVFTPTLVISMLLVIVFGPLANMSSKWAFTLSAYTVPPKEVVEGIDMEKYDDNTAQIMFKHVTTLLWCLIFYVIDSRILYKRGSKPIFTDRATIEGHRELGRSVITKMLLLSAIPAFCDFGFSMLQSSATKMMRSSTVQMISNLNVLLVAGLSMLLMKKAITLGQWFGIFIVCIGVVLSGLDGLLFPDVNSIAGNGAIAITSVVVAAFLRALGTVLEQKYISGGRPIPIFKLYAVQQTFAVGYILITMFIKFLCGSHDFVETFWQYYNEPALFGIMCLHGISATMLNSFGIIVGKLSNPIFRILCMSTRTITSWFIELAVGWNSFKWLTLSGQLILALGIVLYTGVLYPGHLDIFRIPWTLHGRLQPTPDAVLSEKQVLMRDAYLQKKAAKEAIKQQRQELTTLQVESQGLPMRSSSWIISYEEDADEPDIPKDPKEFVSLASQTMSVP